MPFDEVDFEDWAASEDQGLPVCKTMTEESTVNSIPVALEAIREDGDHDNEEDEVYPSSEEMRAVISLLKKGLKYYDFDFLKQYDFETEVSRAMHQNFQTNCN